VKAVIEQHLAMVDENQTGGCRSSQNGTAKNPRTPWARDGTGQLPQVRCKHATPELTPPPAGTPPAPYGDSNHAQSSKIPNLPARYEYYHAPLPGAQFFNHDTYAKDSEHNEDCIPDLPNDEGTSTG